MNAKDIFELALQRLSDDGCCVQMPGFNYSNIKTPAVFKYVKIGNFDRPLYEPNELTIPEMRYTLFELMSKHWNAESSETGDAREYFQYYQHADNLLKELGDTPNEYRAIVEKHNDMKIENEQLRKKVNAITELLC